MEELQPHDADVQTEDAVAAWYVDESDTIYALKQIGLGQEFELINETTGDTVKTIKSHKDNALGDARRYLREQA